MNLINFRNILPTFFLFGLSVTTAFISPVECAAQDLIARQAPVDRKMKAVDSVAISRLLKRQKATNYENNDLYSSWQTDKVHCYSESELPDHYRIDLRGFCMPTPSRVITSNYGYRASFGRMHKGLDIKVYTGDTITSAFDGKVRIVSYEAKGYGNYVVIRHNNGLETIYGHLSKHLCKVNDIVKAGQPIGLGGNTGRSTGSHLHFETRLLGEAIDPALLFDFVAQDVTCDFYDFQKTGGRKTTEHNIASNAKNDEKTNEVSSNEFVMLEEDEDVSKTFSNSEHNKKEKKKSAKVYKVRKGDTLYSISHRVGCTVQQLCSRNNIRQNSKLQLGQVLRY